MNLIEWPGYVEPQWVKPLQQQTGCVVHNKDAGTSDEMVQLMRTGQYDGVSASGNATERLVDAGDVSPVNDNFDPKAPENKNSALVWHYGGFVMPRPKTGRPVFFGRTMSTCAIKDDLVYVAEEEGYFHCLDARTGQKYWDHDFKSSVWGSPYWADGKIYQGVEDGIVYVFAHGKQKKLIHENDMGDAVQSTPVVANGVLYVTTKAKLYAIGQK